MGITVGATTITCDCCGVTCDETNPATYVVESFLGNKVLCTATGGHDCVTRIKADAIAATGSLSYTLSKAAHLAAGYSNAHP